MPGALLIPRCRIDSHRERKVDPRINYAGWCNMLRTLKIAKLLAALAAVGFIAYLAVSGMKPDDQTVAILAKKSAVELFRKLSDMSDDTKNKESEFVKQAHKFALRINPPKPVVTKTTNEGPTKLTPDKVKTVRPKGPTRTSKFSLVATCRYESQPEKSLAQLNIAAEGKKWVRQGDIVGHLTVHEVKDGSIVLYQGENLNTEIFVPLPKATKSLLKSDEEIGAISEPENIAGNKTEIIYEAVTNTPPSKADAMRNKRPTAGRVPTVSRAGVLRPPTSKKTYRRKPTPEERRKFLKEQKESLDKNISQIQNIMKENRNSSKKDGQGEDVEAWGTLIKLLEEDKQSMEAESSEMNQKGKKGEPAKKAPKSSKDKKPANTQG